MSLKKTIDFIFNGEEFFVFQVVRKIKSKEEYKRLVSNFFSLSLLRATNYIFPLITFPYLVRVLGVEKFGLLAFATATIMYFQIITDYGFNLTATREASIHRDNKEKLTEIFSSVITIKFVLMFVSLLLLTILVFGFEKFSKDWLVYFLTFGTVVGQVLFPVWFFQGMERMEYITFLNILAKFIFTSAIFVFVQKQSDFWKVPLLNSIGFLIAGIVSLYKVKKDFQVGFKWQSTDKLRYYLVDGWSLFLSSFASNFYRNFNTIVLGFLTNNIFVGYYYIAEKVVMVIQTLQDVIGTALFPYFSKEFKSNKARFFTITKNYIKPIVSIYTILVVILYLSSGIVTKIISGNFDVEITLNMRIISVVILIGGMNYYFGILGLVALNYKKDFSKFIIITGIFNIIASFVLVYFLKDVGASVSLVLSESVLLYLILRKIRGIAKYES